MTQAEDGATAGGPEPADRLDQVERTVDRLTVEHRLLAAGFRRVAFGKSRDSDALEPLDDLALSEEEQLVAWVRWLTERYELGGLLPACWPKHGQLVEEFDALRVGWRDSIGAGQGGPAAMQWHDGFARVLDRLDHRWRVCPDGTHRDSEPADWLADGPLGADDIDLGQGRFPGS